MKASTLQRFNSSQERKTHPGVVCVARSSTRMLACVAQLQHTETEAWIQGSSPQQREIQTGI